MIEMAFGKFVHAVIAAPGIAHIGYQHRIVEGRNVKTVARQNGKIVFDVLSDLEKRRIGERLAEQFDDALKGKLTGHKSGAEQTIALAMLERNITGFVHAG